jgi:hypothetical protein
MASVARTRLRAALIGAAGGLIVSLALAQSPVQPRDRTIPDPNDTVPEKVRPGEPDTTGSLSSPETLSDKLNRSEGVIKPLRDLDPEMDVPAPVPNPGTTLVLPPPGSPGGDERFQPK